MWLKHTLLVVLAPLATGGVHAANWQYSGYTKTQHLETHQFFDAESVTSPNKDVRRVWVKSVTAQNLDRYSKAHKDAVVDQTARKVVVGYLPKFLELQAIKEKYTDSTALKEDGVMLTTYEVMANAAGLRAYSKLYFEIDCAGKRIKLLDGLTYKANGDIANTAEQRNREYQFIPPDSQGEWLSLLVCQPR